MIPTCAWSRLFDFRPNFKIYDESGAITQILGRVAVSCFYPATESAGKKAREIMKKSGINAMDALHLAVAIENNAEIFVTTDNSILNKSDHILKSGIIAKNPCEVNMPEGSEGSKDHRELMEKVFAILDPNFEDPISIEKSLTTSSFF